MKNTSLRIEYLRAVSDYCTNKTASKKLTFEF